MTLIKEAQLIENVLTKLSFKDSNAVTFAATQYIYKKETPKFRGIRKAAFEKIIPALNEYIHQIALQNHG